MARAMGGEVVTDRSRAEVGTYWLELTSEGKNDPVFGPLGGRLSGPDRPRGYRNQAPRRSHASGV